MVSIEKTKSMVFGNDTIKKKLHIGKDKIENVTEFVYLGSLLTFYNSCSKEIKRRIDKAMAAMAGFSTVWRNRHISLQVKLKVLHVCVFSVLLYACETWTLKKTDRDKLLAFENKCYRWILQIRWQQKITNESIHQRIKVKQTVVQTIIRRKLQTFGHICRMKEDRLIKTVLFGIMDGKTRTGRPCREWTDDITEWCNKDLHTLKQKALNREEWQNIVQHASNTNG